MIEMDATTVVVTGMVGVIATGIAMLLGIGDAIPGARDRAMNLAILAEIATTVVIAVVIAMTEDVAATVTTGAAAVVAPVATRIVHAPPMT